MDRNIYNNNIPNYPFNPSFNFQCDYIPKTQENSYYNYCDHKSMPYLQQYRDNDNNIMLNDIKSSITAKALEDELCTIMTHDETFIPKKKVIVVKHRPVRRRTAARKRRRRR